MHRDLWTAFLARHTNDDECLSLQSAQQEWKRSEPILRSAWQTYQINREPVSESESRLGHSSSERFDLKPGNISQISCEGLKANVKS